jgi:DNA repair protein RadD
VAQAPTGFGKTIVGATLAKRNLDERRRTLFIVPALSLIDQTAEKFYAEGIRDIGVIQANHELTNWSGTGQQSWTSRPRTLAGGGQ